MKYVIANWKANKDIDSAIQWIQSFRSYDLNKLSKDIEIIICPHYHLISEMKRLTSDLEHVSYGVQNISTFDNGPYTGEVTAASLKGLVTYAIIGHSERRKYLMETNADIEKKVQNAKDNQIIPLFCVRNNDDIIFSGLEFIVFEPPEGISKGDGYGKTASIDSVINMKNSLKLESHHKFIYGASVNPENASSFLNHPEIDGVLPGGASLNPALFYAICLAYRPS